MQVQRELPLMGRVSVGAKNALLSSLLRASAHLPEGFLIKTVRGIAGTNDFPMGQKFLEKALVSTKRAIKQSNPRSRRKLLDNLILGEMVRGQAERNWVTKQLGYEIPLLLVISPTMRCPLRCYGCYAAEYGQDSDLDFESFDRLIREAKALGIYFFVLSGGEPLAYKRIEEIFRKHSDAWFQVYTSGVTLNPTCVGRLAELGNVMPCLSVEGFEAETDRRRGAGHFAKLLSAFANLRAAGIPFGFSATATRENNELVVSDDFVRFYLEQGALLGWYFQYMPIGREPALDLMPTPEQRLLRFHRLLELREKFDVLLTDFWNDGPLVGGCIAGSRRYLHVNNKGDVEPCVFCQLTTDNIHDKSLLDILQTSRLLAAIRRRQPYSDNYLRPCMMLDNPQTLKEVIEEADPRETCRGGARRLVNDLYPQLQAYASRWGELADEEWRKRYQEAYRETLAKAHALSATFARCHEACREEKAARCEHPTSGVGCDYDKLSATI